MSPALETCAAVLEFWFGADSDDAETIGARNRRWFGVDHTFDTLVRERFADTLRSASRGTLPAWKLEPAGALALILVFDQFPRNMFRGTARAFATDTQALALCRDAIALQRDKTLSVVERTFLYLPLEHAENRDAQVKSVACYSELHACAPAPLRQYTAQALRQAEVHCALVSEFGRFPHRNLVLNRKSTGAEEAWLSAHGGSYNQG